MTPVKEILMEIRKSKELNENENVTKTIDSGGLFHDSVNILNAIQLYT